MLTVNQLKAALTYDPVTGIFRRRVTTSSRAIAGQIAGYVDPSHGYRSIRVGGREHYAHRLAWLYMNGEFPKSRLDHKNGNRDDNRISNLRLATHQQNNKNRGINARNTSGVKGVTWHAKAGKWMAQIANDGKHHYLGLFVDIGDAKRAYDAAAERLHGEFARGL